MTLVDLKSPTTYVCRGCKSTLKRPASVFFGSYQGCPCPFCKLALAVNARVTCPWCEVVLPGEDYEYQHYHWCGQAPGADDSEGSGTFVMMSEEKAYAFDGLPLSSVWVEKKAGFCRRMLVTGYGGRAATMRPLVFLQQLNRRKGQPHKPSMSPERFKKLFERSS